MRHMIFEESNSFEVAILSKAAAFKQAELISSYVEPLVHRGVPKDKIVGFTLEVDDSGKLPVKFVKNYIDNLLPALDRLGVKFLYVADGTYFKVLTKMSKAEPHYGYVLPCKIEGYGHMQVVLGLNYQQLIYNPALESRLIMSIQCLADAVGGNYQALGQNIIHSAQYPMTLGQIQEALDTLYRHKSLAIDIEAFSLRHNEAGIATITFCWDKHNGIAFPVDYQAIPEATTAPYGRRIDNRAVKDLLIRFFLTYKGEMKWHNAAYDLRSIIYELYMSSPTDQVGLLRGLDAMIAKCHDTKVIAYLAINSTAGNELGLKTLAHEFAGNWAVGEINNVLAIPLNKLLEYNLVDGLSTNFVFDKYYPIMVQDKQEDLYKNLMMPSLKVIIQMELTGMPMDRKAVSKAEKELTDLRDGYTKFLSTHPVIRMLNLVIQKDAMVKANAKLKTKQHPIEHFKDVVFNPNSNPNIQYLVYTQMGLPVIDLTDTKQPATGADTLAKLINHTDNQAYKEILQALIDYSGVNKILSSFIPSFNKGINKAGGRKWLHGGFNLGGTVSGRLSSSKPNMQQIPSGSEFGKLIKQCFSAPNGWIFAGADFNSLNLATL